MKATLNSQIYNYKRKYFTRRLDCSNPRYYADKPPSQVGLIAGQKTRPNGFADPTPSEISKFWKEEENERKLQEMISEAQGKGGSETKSVDPAEGRDPPIPA